MAKVGLAKVGFDRIPRRPSPWVLLQPRRRWPVQLVFSTRQDQVVLDLGHPAFPLHVRGSLRFLVLNSCAESKTGFSSSTSSGLTLAELWEFCLSRWLHASTTKQSENCVMRSHSHTREHIFNLTVIAERSQF